MQQAGPPVSTGPPQPQPHSSRSPPPYPHSHSPSSDQHLHRTPKSEPHTDDDHGDHDGGDDGHNHKQNRLRKACDSCSLRKVKCDAQQPCRACRALDIPCTFARPTRRRGPPNRLAESIKKAHRDSHRPSSPYMTPSPTRSSQEYSSHQTSSYPSLSAESICPLELVKLLIDDYFQYVHPIQPFPHEPSFRKAFAERRDLHDGPFLALIAAMVGSLVAAFPRRPRKRLKIAGMERMFPSSVAFVKHCQKIIAEARGPGYLERDDLNAYDAATSYCLLTMCATTLKWNHGGLYLGECYTIISCLLSQGSGDLETLPGPQRLDDSNGAGPVDHIEREMVRRVFWTVFVTIRSSKLFGVAMGHLQIKPSSPTQAYPPLPAELDDQYIHQTYLEQQPRTPLSKMTGFNTNCRIYLTHDPLVALEDSYSINHFDWDKQKSILRDCVENVKHCFDGLDEQLLVWPGPPSRSPSSGCSTLREYGISQTSTPTNDQHRDIPKRHHIAVYEIQKANIHASYLSSRSYFIERYWDLASQRGMDAATAADIRRERESIAEDLLNVLSSIRPVHMEPNGVSFLMKIRQIASTLMPSARSEQSAPSATTLPDGGTSAYYLQTFLEILMELEKCCRADDENGDGVLDQVLGDDADYEDGEEDEEDELRQWASLRRRQREFVKSGASVAGALED